MNSFWEIRKTDRHTDRRGSFIYIYRWRASQGHRQSLTLMGMTSQIAARWFAYCICDSSYNGAAVDEISTDTVRPVVHLRQLSCYMLHWFECWMNNWTEMSQLSRVVCRRQLPCAANTRGLSERQSSRDAEPRSQRNRRVRLLLLLLLAGR